MLYYTFLPAAKVAINSEKRITKNTKCGHLAIKSKKNHEALANINLFINFADK